MIPWRLAAILVGLAFLGTAALAIDGGSVRGDRPNWGTAVEPSKNYLYMLDPPTRVRIDGYPRPPCVWRKAVVAYGTGVTELEYCELIDGGYR